MLGLRVPEDLLRSVRAGIFSAGLSLIARSLRSTLLGSISGSVPMTRTSGSLLCGGLLCRLEAGEAARLGLGFFLGSDTLGLSVPLVRFVIFLSRDDNECTSRSKSSFSCCTFSSSARTFCQSDWILLSSSRVDPYLSEYFSVRDSAASCASRAAAAASAASCFASSASLMACRSLLRSE